MKPFPIAVAKLSEGICQSFSHPSWSWFGWSYSGALMALPQTHATQISKDTVEFQGGNLVYIYIYLCVYVFIYLYSSVR